LQDNFDGRRVFNATAQDRSKCLLQPPTFRYHTLLDELPIGLSGLHSGIGDWCSTTYELAVQEVMTGFALLPEPSSDIFLFKDHKITRVRL
jgi:hypothetical protein